MYKESLNVFILKIAKFPDRLDLKCTKFDEKICKSFFSIHSKVASCMCVCKIKSHKRVLKDIQESVVFVM